MDRSWCENPSSGSAEYRRLALHDARVRNLRRAYPDARTDMLVNEHIRETALYNPHLSSIIGIDKNGCHRSPSHFLELVCSTRRSRYAAVINLHGCARIGLMPVLNLASTD